MQTDRQKEIIEVALDLIANKGIQGLTIKNLAREIGISEPAIYRHYENKIQILIAILDLFRINSVNIFENAASGKAGAMAKIDHLFNNHFTTFSANPPLVAVIFSEEIFRNEPVLVEKLSEIIMQNDKMLTSIIIGGQQTGEIRDDVAAGHLAITIMGALRLFIKRWQFTGYAFNLPDEGRAFLQSVKRMIAEVR
jgi:TetR/AcrR family transcriptional regulator, fatty acid metabolism regulator protein